MKKTWLILLLCALMLLTGCGSTDTKLNGIGRDFPEPLASDPTEQPSETAERVEPRIITFAGVGDNIVYYGNVREAAAVSDGTYAYDFRPTYSEVIDTLAGADIAFINQETLMCGDGFDFSYYPHFNGPQDMGLELEEMGFDVVNMATNHMLDQGANGLGATISFWKKRNVLMIGGYESEEDFDTVRIYDAGGVSIAFLSFTYGTNGLSLPASSDLFVPYFEDEDVIRQIKKAREMADLVFVSAHWGEENQFTPNERQKELAQLMADCGADVILGHHPHVIQPVEWLTGENGNRTLCIYSLGNFAAEMAADYNMVGGIITFDIADYGSSVSIESPVFIPTVFDFNGSFYQNRVHFLDDYTEEQASAHGISYYGHYTTLEKLRSYVDNTIAREFLPEDW